jgi:dual specificity phosphatase 12
VTPDLVRACLFISDVNDTIAVLTGPVADVSGPSFTHILSAVSSTSISFITDCHSGLAIPTEEVRRVVAEEEGAAAEVHGTAAKPKMRGTAVAARQLHR